jgi:hypothetical protein
MHLVAISAAIADHDGTPRFRGPDLMLQTETV